MKVTETGGRQEIAAPAERFDNHVDSPVRRVAPEVAA
ncbi:hypothetical protein KE639_05981 [Streptomyces sp. V17-9]|nr:hypothetical protein KE639_05981 [Streptomyces sp. V17-9]